MTHRDFDAARAEQSGEPLTFTLAGQEWVTTPTIEAGSVFDLAALADREDAAAIIAFRDFLLSIMAPTATDQEGHEYDQRLAFADSIRRVDLPTVLAVVQWIVQETTARPFTSPSSSPT